MSKPIIAGTVFLGLTTIGLFMPEILVGIGIWDKRDVSPAFKNSVRGGSALIFGIGGIYLASNIMGHDLIEETYGKK